MSRLEEGEEAKSTSSLLLPVLPYPSESGT